MTVNNLPYRPDLNGIELYWGAVKRVYRKKITNLVANWQTIDNEQIVLDSLDSVPHSEARKAARCGWEAIDEAVPA